MDATTGPTLGLGRLVSMDRSSLEKHKAELFISALQSKQVIQFIALGTSMSPAIPSGALVTISPCHPSLLRCGEVALCILDQAGDSGQAWVLHRVISNQRQQRIVKMAGDRLPISDEIRSYENVLGVLTAIQVERSFGLSLIFTLINNNPRSLYTRALGLSSLVLYRMYSRLKLIIQLLVK